MHPIQKALALVSLPLLLASTVHAAINEPVETVRDANERFLKQMQLEVGNLSSPTALPVVRKSRSLVHINLRAGRCDEAIEVMRKSSSGFSPRAFCFAMAMAGRESEIAAELKPFEEQIEQLIKRWNCSREYFLDVPTLHGSALKSVFDADVDGAANHFKKLEKLRRFSGEFRDIAGAIAFEIYHIAGPERTIEFLEAIAQGNEKQFRSCFNNLESLMWSDERTGLDKALLPHHPDAFIHEISSEANIKFSRHPEATGALVDHAFDHASELGEDRIIRLKGAVHQCRYLEKEIQTKFATDCHQWLVANPDEDGHGMVRQIAPWLIETGQLKEFLTLTESLDKDNGVSYTMAIFAAMKAASKGSTEFAELARQLPPPNQIQVRSTRLKKEIANLLTEGNSLDVAKIWVDSIEVENEQKLALAKLNLYRDVLSDNSLNAASIATRISEATSAFKRYRFRDHLGNDFVARLATNRNLKLAFEVAQALVKDLRRGESAVGICVDSFIQRGDFESALKISEFASQEEILQVNLAHDSVSTLRLKAPDTLDRFIMKFPNSIFLHREKIRQAIEEGDKEKAIELHEKHLALHGDSFLEISFVDAGWETEYLASSKRGCNELKLTPIEAQTLFEKITIRTIEALSFRRDAASAIELMKHHIKDPKKRIRIMEELSKEYVNSPSFRLWTQLTP